MNQTTYKPINFEKLDPEIKKIGCIENCAIFFEKRFGEKGPFFYCHKCTNSISISPRGDIDKPCGVCDICHGFLFWRINNKGQKWKACWSFHKHFKK